MRHDKTPGNVIRILRLLFNGHDFQLDFAGGYVDFGDFPYLLAEEAFAYGETLEILPWAGSDSALPVMV